MKTRRRARGLGLALAGPLALSGCGAVFARLRPEQLDSTAQRLFPGTSVDLAVLPLFFVFPLGLPLWLVDLPLSFALDVATLPASLFHELRRPERRQPLETPAQPRPQPPSQEAPDEEPLPVEPVPPPSLELRTGEAR